MFTPAAIVSRPAWHQ